MKKLVLASALFLLPGTAMAQFAPKPWTPCFATIPRSALKRVPVLVEATAGGPLAAAILPSADLFAQSVAFKVRELLGSKDESLPEADSAVAWHTLGGQLLVNVRPNGTYTWTTPEWSAGADTSARSGFALLKKAVTDLAKSNEWIAWPEGVKADSLGFGLSYLYPGVTREGKAIPVTTRQAIPAFTIAIPWERPVSATRSPRIDYPSGARTFGANGGVRLAMAVDSTGKIVPESVSEVFLPGEKRPVGELGAYYESFLREVKRALPSARFSPGLVGGCKVTETMAMFFQFNVDR